MKVTRRRLWASGTLALLVAIAITLVVAPFRNQLSQGSTYSRAPDGYGAWYAFMRERGTPVRRWQKPLQSLKEEEELPITLLQVYGKLQPLPSLNLERKWVERGNNLVILGVKQPVTGSAFSTQPESSAGKVKIDTRRRKPNQQGTAKLLGDSFGAIVWAENVGKGQIIYSASSYLAANAYQDWPGNYEFLAQLVTKSGNPVWVDEYLHGYRDEATIKQEIGDNLFSYFAKTPLLPALLQGAVILAVAIWAGNRRFGRPVPLSSPTPNNSEAYIRALAEVLQQAGSRDFVVSALAAEEQKQLQASWGLDSTLLPSSALIDVWVQQTGQPASELAALLQVANRQKPLSDGELLAWLAKWQQIHQQFTPNHQQ